MASSTACSASSLAISSATHAAKPHIRWRTQRAPRTGGRGSDTPGLGAAGAVFAADRAGCATFQDGSVGRVASYVSLRGDHVAQLWLSTAVRDCVLITTDTRGVCGTARNLATRRAAVPRNAGRTRREGNRVRAQRRRACSVSGILPQVCHNIWRKSGEIPVSRKGSCAGNLAGYNGMFMNHGRTAKRMSVIPERQNAFGKPACASTALAVCRDLISLSTGKVRPEIGLNQIS